MSKLYDALKGTNAREALALIQAGGHDFNFRGPEGVPGTGDGGATCLIAAIKNFDMTPDVLGALIEKGADVNMPDTLDAETPLMWAARTYPYGAEWLFEALINKGADLERKNKHGETALLVAAASGAANVCALLIKKGANHKIKDRKGNTVLQVAADVPTQSSIQEAIDN